MRYLVRRGIEDLMTIRLGALAEKTSLRSIGQSQASSLDSTYHRGEELVLVSQRFSVDHLFPTALDLTLDLLWTKILNN